MLLHLRPFLDTARHGRIYRDSFYQPYASWYPELPRRCTSGCCGSRSSPRRDDDRLLTRVATVTTFTIVAYDLFLSTTNMHNNRAYLMVVLAALAVTPCGRELSVDAWLRRRQGRPPFRPTRPAGPCGCCASRPRRLRRVRESKLLDPDWFGGR